MGLLADVRILDVRSTVSYEKSAPVPGGLTSIFVQGIDRLEGTVVNEHYPAPTSIAGIRVRVHGVYAPVLLVSQLNGYQQINVQVPWKIDVASRPAIKVIDGESVVSVDQIEPGLLDSIYAGDDGYALAYHADWSPVTASNPARDGESILLATAFSPPITIHRRLSRTFPQTAICFAW